MIDTLKIEVYTAIKTATEFAKRIKDKNSKTDILNTEYYIGQYHAYLAILEKIDFASFVKVFNECQELWEFCNLAVEKLYK